MTRLKDLALSLLVPAALAAAVALAYRLAPPPEPTSHAAESPCSVPGCTGHTKGPQLPPLQ